MLRDEIEKKILLRKVFKTKQIAIKRMRIKSIWNKLKDEIVKKSILKTISNKINSNQRNIDKIWQIKKIEREWNFKNIQFDKLFQIK